MSKIEYSYIHDQYKNLVIKFILDIHPELHDVEPVEYIEYLRDAEVRALYTFILGAL